MNFKGLEVIGVHMYQAALQISRCRTRYTFTWCCWRDRKPMSTTVLCFIFVLLLSGPCEVWQCLGFIVTFTEQSHRKAHYGLLFVCLSARLLVCPTRTSNSTWRAQLMLTNRALLAWVSINYHSFICCISIHCTYHTKSYLYSMLSERWYV